MYHVFKKKKKKRVAPGRCSANDMEGKTGLTSQGVNLTRETADRRASEAAHGQKDGPSPSLGKEGRLLLSVPKSVPNGGPYGDRGGSRSPPLGGRRGKGLKVKGSAAGQSSFITHRFPGDVLAARCFVQGPALSRVGPRGRGQLWPQPPEAHSLRQTGF